MLPIIALTLALGCDEGDTVVDDVVANTTRGAALRTINIISNDLPIGVADAGFAVDLEIQDGEEGALVSTIDVFIAFRDNTVETGAEDLDVAEGLFTTISSDTFEPGPFGLPRTSFSASLTEMLTFTGVAESDLFGGDQFQIRFELVFSDGRTFSSTNSNPGNLGGSFFISPFLYFPTVSCPIPETSFVGSYLIEQTSALVDGFTLSSETATTLSIGETPTRRVFDTFNYPSFCATNNPFAFDLICGAIAIPNQNSNCVCGDGADWFTDPEERETYRLNDDSSFSITFTDDAQSDCGSPV